MYVLFKWFRPKNILQQLGCFDSKMDMDAYIKKHPLKNQAEEYFFLTLDVDSGPSVTVFN